MTDPVEPVRIVLLDGKERLFLLSAGALRRVREKLKAGNLQEVLERDIEAAGPALLWEALREKNGITEEDFLELLPADLPVQLNATMTLLDRSYPERKRKAEEETARKAAAANPPVASPMIQ